MRGFLLEKMIQDIVTTNFTRPSDTTQYAAGEVVSDSTSTPTYMTFPRMSRDTAGHITSGGTIYKAQLVDSANQSTKGSFELFLFNVAPTAMEDNAAFDPTDAELKTVVGVIPFTLWNVGNAGSGATGNAMSNGTLTEPIIYEVTGTIVDLYGILVARNTYTPVSDEIFDIFLHIEKN